MKCGPPTPSQALGGGTIQVGRQQRQQGSEVKLERRRDSWLVVGGGRLGLRGASA